MCFQMECDFMDLPLFDEQGRELASRSPWRFLDECKTPAERQAAIYRHQHKTRAHHFAVQDRAEDYRERWVFWKEAAGKNIDRADEWRDRALAAKSGLRHFAECFAASALFVALAGAVLLWIAG